MKYLWIIPVVLLLTCAGGDRDNPFDPDGDNWNPPVVTIMANDSVNIKDTIAITATAIDNGAIAKYVWALNAASYSDTTTAGSIRSAFVNAGARKVLVKAVDNDGVESQPDTCVITVTLDPPVVTAMNPATVNINDSITLTATATDNGAIVKFLWALEGQTFTDTTETGAYPTAFFMEGINSVSVIAVDDDSIESQPAFCMIVVTLDAPVLTVQRDTVVTQAMSVTVNMTAVDTNLSGSIVKYYWDTGADGWNDSTIVATYTVSNPAGGLLPVIWGARDDDAQITTDTFDIIFSRPPTNVEMNEPVDNDTAEWISYDPDSGKGSVLIRFSGTDPDGFSDTLTYTLSIGKNAGSLLQVYNGEETLYMATGIDTSAIYYWRITAKDLWGDTVAATGMFVAPAPNTVTDIDGNVYQTIRIGNQLWTMENLRTARLNDGTAIPAVTDSSAWAGLTTPGYCFYNNDTLYKDTCGALYNWYAVETGKLAPAGWRVPTDADWDTLQIYLIDNGYNWDGTTDSNKIAKSLAATTKWSMSINPGAVGNDLTENNRSGLSVLPGGYRYTDGDFYYVGKNGHLWSGTDANTMNAFSGHLTYDQPRLFRVSYPKSCGFSVRLVKDN